MGRSVHHQLRMKRIFKLQGSTLSRPATSGLFKSDEVTTLANLFDGCTALSEVRMDYCNTGKVTSMNEMFKNCNSLRAIDLSKWNTVALSTAVNMFKECESLEEVNLSGWDISNVTSFRGMFIDSPKLRTVDISNWNTPSKPVNCFGMFSGTAITRVNIPAIPAVRLSDANEVFKNCEVLESVVLSGQVTGASSMTSMFEGCTALVSVNLSGWTLPENVNLTSMFRGCTSLKSVNLSGWRLTGTSNILTDMFKNCPIEEFIIRNSDDDTVSKLLGQISGNINVIRL